MNVAYLLEAEKSLLQDIITRPAARSIEKKIVKLKEIHAEIIKESCWKVIEDEIKHNLKVNAVNGQVEKRSYQ